MAITFPVNPAGQTPVNTFSPTSTPLANSANSLTYTWDGVSWTSSQAGNYVNATGDTMTGPLVVPTVTAQDITTGGNTVVGYQQGTWTPVVANGTANFLSPTWYRIGDQVTIRFRANTFSNNTTNTGISMSGIPYAAAPTAAGYVGPTMTTQVSSPPQCSYMNTSGDLNWYVVIDGENWRSLKYQDLDNTDATTQLLFEITYLKLPVWRLS